MAEIESPLPHNKDAEAIILGTVMVEQGLVPVLINGITREDFYLPSHRVVYAAIRDLYMSHKVIDPITTWDRIQAIEADGRPSGMNPAGLAALLDGTARIKDEHYLLGLMETVKIAALRRRLIRYGEYLANQAKQPDVAVEQLIGDMARRAGEYANDSGESSDLISAEDAVGRTIDQLEERWSSGSRVGLTTGFPDLDKQLGGLRGGSVYIIASAPNVGKTTLVLNVVRGLLGDEPAATGLIVSMEMPVEQLMVKSLSTETRLASQAIDSGKDIKGLPLDRDAQRRILKAGDRLGGQQLFFLEGFKTVTPATVAAKLDRIRALKGRIDFLVVDYLQLMQADGAGKGTTEYQSVSEISRAMKRIAVQFNIPILLVSQLSRNHASRSDRGFKLSDLRGSGSIEQDADVVIFLEPEDWDDETQPGRKLVIAKNRFGAKHGVVNLVFFGHQSRFESVEYEGA